MLELRSPIDARTFALVAIALLGVGELQAQSSGGIVRQVVAEPAAPPPAVTHDNREPAGTTVANVPKLRLEVVPGITSINACSAIAGYPLANGDERIAVIPATYEIEKLRGVLREFDSIVLMKVNNVFDQVLTVLEEEGLADTAVYVKKVGSAEQEIVRDIRTLTGKKLEYLATILVHRPE